MCVCYVFGISVCAFLFVHKIEFILKKLIPPSCSLAWAPQKQINTSHYFHKVLRLDLALSGWTCWLNIQINLLLFPDAITSTQCSSQCCHTKASTRRSHLSLIVIVVSWQHCSENVQQYCVPLHNSTYLRINHRPCPVCTIRLQGASSYCHSCVTTHKNSSFQCSAATNPAVMWPLASEGFCRSTCMCHHADFYWWYIKYYYGYFYTVVLPH